MKVPDMNTTTWQERYMLKNPDHRFDKIPEILDGKNIADFVDAGIFTFSLSFLIFV